MNTSRKAVATGNKLTAPALEPLVPEQFENGVLGADSAEAASSKNASD
jgi:hypothetical protein